MIYLKDKGEELVNAYDDEIEHEGNSKYQLSFKYPTSDQRWKQVGLADLVVADDLHGEQEFRVFEIVKRNGYIYVYANQVMDDLSSYSISSVSVDRVSGQTAMQALAGSIIRKHPFTFYSDIQDRHTFNQKNVSVMDALAKGKHSIIGQWSGDLVRDKYQVHLLKNGGRESEALFMYKKNLKSYAETTSIKGLVTRLNLSIKDSDVTATVDSPLTAAYGGNIYELNIEVADQDVRTLEQLREYGRNYFAEKLVDIPNNSLTISVTDNQEYNVRIFDKVFVHHEVFDKDLRMKITSYKYSPMGRKLKSVGFGKIKTNLTQQISAIASDETERSVSIAEHSFENKLRKEMDNSDQVVEQKLSELKSKVTDDIERSKASAEAHANAIKRSLSAQFEEAEQQFLSQNQAQNAQIEAVRRQADVTQNLAEEAKRLGNQAKTEASNALSWASQLKAEAVAEANRLLTVERQAIDTKLATAKSQAITEAGRLVDAAKALLGFQMTNLSTDLARTKEEIKLLASRTDLNALTGRLSSVEATIRLQADQILQRVKTVDLDQAKQRIFTAETAINQMGNRITTEISEVTTKVDKLGFGSRNYVEDYDFSRGLWEYSQGDNSARNWSVENGVYTLTTTTGTWHQFQIHSESGRRLGGKKDSTALLELAVGETYTLSVEVKRNSGSGRFWVEVRDNGMANYNNVVVHVSNFSNSPTATSEWQRYSYTFTCKAKSDFSHRRVILGYNEIGSISFRKVELTQGTKFSDAGPAPEDTQTDISAVKTIITKTAEGVEQLSTKQVQTDGKLTNVETQIRQLIGDVSSKVSQTDFDTVKRTVQHQETKIAQNNQSILLKADKQTVEGVKSQAEEALAKAQSNATTISRATAQLQVVADAVETKATKTDLNNLTGRMTNAETTIRTQAGQIEQRLTRSQVDQLVDGKGLATTNLVRETAESFSRTLTQVENKIPTEIGARNYIQDFGFAENHTFYNNSSLWNYERIADPTARSGYHIKATCTRAGSGGFYRMLFDLRGAEWQGRIMTYSVDIKCSKNVRMRLGPEAFENYGTQTMDVGTTWKRFVSSRTVRFVTYYSFRFYTGNTQWAIGDVIYLRDPQLEDGALATTPRPALEDLATVTALHEVRDTVSSHTRTISEQGRSISQAIQTANGILVRVGSLENTTATKSALTAVQTEVSQLAGSWAVRNLTNAGTILNQINLLANGNNRIDGRLTHITGQTLIDNGVIKTAMIYSLDAGKITSGYIASERFQANSITGAHIVADQALFNKLGANEAYLKQLFAKQAFLTSVQAVDLSANRIKGGMLASLNGATAFNMSSGALDFYTDNPALRRVLNGYPTQFLRFTTGNSSGNKVGVTILGSNRRGSETSNDGGFVGIRAWNGANDDKLDLVGDTIRLASSAFNDADGWTLNTLPGNLTLEAFRPADRLSSKMKVGDIFLWRTETSYNSLKNIINSIIENIRLLHANKSTQNSYTYNLPIKF